MSVAPVVNQRENEPHEWGAPRYAVILGIAVCSWALLGIATRPAGQLAAFWPANALLLGLLIRYPAFATWQGWCAAVPGYLLADLLTGGNFLLTLYLTGANLAGVATGYILFQQVSEPDRRLTRPFSVLYLIVIVVLASAMAGFVGALIDPIVFGRSALGGWAFWFVTEMVNYVAFLPLMLTLPLDFKWNGVGVRKARLRPIFTIQRAARLLPATAVLLSAIASLLLPGPGSVAFPVPALLWCAVTYGLFANAVLAFLFCAWTLLAISTGYLHVAVDIGSREDLLSLRAGVTLVALAPLVVATVMASRNELVARLQRLATHDYLTGLLNRTGFYTHVQDTLPRLARSKLPVAVMMIDIDHFKMINDRHSHAAGDLVLAAVAQSMRTCVRTGDALGRIGGEEFCVFLDDVADGAPEAMAARICDTVSATRVTLPDGTELATTVSVGVALANEAPTDISGLVAGADIALYRAKDQGRNRYEILNFN